MNRIVSEALLAARESLKWFADEHPCCAGAESDAMAKIDIALAEPEVSQPQPAPDVVEKIREALGLICNARDEKHWPTVGKAHELLFQALSALPQRPVDGCCVPDAGEPSFVLLGRDPQAPALVELWATDRVFYEPHSDKPAKAREIAQRMREFKAVNPSKGMKAPSYDVRAGKLRSIHSALALLNSMVRAGEQHTTTSEQVFCEAVEYISEMQRMPVPSGKQGGGK